MLGNTLTIKITNSNPSPQPWNAFGFNEGIQNNSGVVISIAQSSSDQATRESSTVPFIIDTIKVKSPTAINLDNPIIIRHKDSTGELMQAQLTPSDYLIPSYYVQNLVVIRNANIEIFGPISLQGTIDANSEMTILLDIVQKKLISSFINSAIKFLGDYKIKISRQISPGMQFVS